MWREIGLLGERREVGVAEMTIAAYADHSNAKWEVSITEAPHGKRWHTSFHASRFPGSNPLSCDREAMYELLAIPPAKAAPPFLVAISDAGKDIENQIVYRWLRSGKLVSAAPGSKVQTGFEDPEHWLTCSLDAALDMRDSGWPHVHPVDIKGKDHMVVESMISGKKGPEEGHIRQVMVQIHFCRMFHEKMGWDKIGLQPAKGGSLLYVSRARPMTMQEFYIEYDEEVMRVGLERLKKRQLDFMQGTLPPRDKTWSWAQDPWPCRWCNFKKQCKADVRAGIDKLRDSHAVAHAAAVNPNYKFDAVYDAVFDRWNPLVKGTP